VRQISYLQWNVDHGFISCLFLSSSRSPPLHSFYFINALNVISERFLFEWFEYRAFLPVPRMDLDTRGLSAHDHGQRRHSRRVHVHTVQQLRQRGSVRPYGRHPAGQRALWGPLVVRARNAFRAQPVLSGSGEPSIWTNLAWAFLISHDLQPSRRIINVSEKTFY